MTFTINKVLLAGRIGDYSVKLTYLPSGNPELSMTLIVERPVGEKVYKTFVLVQVYGAECEPLAETLEPGDLIMVDGQLGYKADRRADTGKGDKRQSSQLAVTCFGVEVLQRADIPQAST